MKILLFIILFFCASSGKAQFKADSISFFFDFGKNQPLAIDSTLFLKLKDLQEVNLIAYTDTVGSKEFNFNLAKQRAESVMKLLPTSCKISTFLLEGETSMFGPDESNRRVVLKFQVSVKGELVREVLNLNIKFVGNQAVVLSKSYSIFDELIDKIKANTYTKIELHGHVCCSADMPLSQKRALAIKQKLVENGVDESIIECYGHSNFEPLVPEYNENDQEKNRRVEVVLIKSEIQY